MQSVSKDTFGPLIAYLVPGATVLLGLSPYSATLRSWLAAAPSGAPSIGGFLYLTVAALSAGMVAGAVRWATVDPVLRLAGVRPPSIDFGGLGRNVEAFAMLIEIHYRHYLFYANMIVATAVAYTAYRIGPGGHAAPNGLDLAVLALEGVFAAAAKDTLSKYYARSRQLLAKPSGGRGAR
jgi:hypothetical protein